MHKEVGDELTPSLFSGVSQPLRSVPLWRFLMGIEVKSFLLTFSKLR